MELVYVDETDMEDLKTIFERAGSFKPNRDINVLFSGGEATLSRSSLTQFDTRRAWLPSSHVSTNGIRFAESRDLLSRRAPRLHGVYLQFDGVSEEKNKHRGLGNYMDVKLRALENIAAAGMQTTCKYRGQRSQQ